MTRLLLFAVLYSMSQAVIAWNSFGHMVMAAIAYQHLTPDAGKQAAQLLRLNPSYENWVQGVPAEQRDETAFIKAATWPDEIKGTAGYRDDKDTSPEAARNIGYSDKLRHRYWHFIDLPFSPDSTAQIQPVAPNAQTQIAEFRKVLASGASPELKSYDLAWLLHLVGDAHQPLHAAARFTKDTPKGDRGGNLVKICTKKCNGDLHSYWDDALGRSTKIPAVKRAAARLLPADPDQAAISDESKWLEESFALAKSSVYVDPVGPGSGPYRVDQNYRLAARKVAGERISLAGARLANLLNETLGKGR